MHDAHAPLLKNKFFPQKRRRSGFSAALRLFPVFILQQKSRKRCYAVPTPLSCSGFALPEKARRHSAYPVKHTPTAEDVFYDGTHRIAIAFLKDGKNGRIFLQAQQCLTLYGYSKSPTLFRNKSVGPLRWYRRKTFIRNNEGNECCRALRILLNLT